MELISKRTILPVLVVSAICAYVFFYSSTAAHAAWSLGFPQAALTLDRNDASLAFKIGGYYYGGGAYDVPSAQAAYEKAIAIDPNIAYAHYELGRVLFVKGEFAAALLAFNEELQIHPNNLRPYYMRGLTYAYAGDFASAEADFKKFISSAPTEWAGYNDLAWVLGREEKYAEAEALLTAALQTIPGGEGNPWLLNNLGVQQLNLKKYSDAAASFESAQKIAANLTPEMWHRAYPGNDAAASVDGIAQFQAALEANLKKAQEGAAL